MASPTPGLGFLRTPGGGTADAPSAPTPQGWATLGERWDEEDYVDLVRFLAVTLIFVAAIVGLLLLVGQCTAGDHPT